MINNFVRYVFILGEKIYSRRSLTWNKIILKMDSEKMKLLPLKHY